MSDSTALSFSQENSTEIILPLRQRIGELRRRLVLWFMASGLAKTFVAAIFIFLLDLAIDRFFQLDVAQRRVMLGIMVLTILWVAWRRWLRPLMERISDDALCIALAEKAEGKGAGRFLGALELSRMDIQGRKNMSPELMQSAVEQGAKAANDVDIREVLREGNLTANFLLAVLAGVSLFGGVIFALARPDSTVGIWLQRNLLLQNAFWPQDHYLEIEAFNQERNVLQIPRGDDWTIRALVKEGAFAKPVEAKIEFQREGRIRSETMDAADDRLSFSAFLPVVTEPFSFRIVTDKVRTDWFAAELVERPQIQSIQLTVTPPPYTGQAKDDLPPGSGPYRILAGSELALRGTSSQPLAGGSLEGADQPIPVAAQGNDFSLVIPPEMLVSGGWKLTLQSKSTVRFPGDPTPQALSPREPLRFRLRVVPDESPKVTATVPGLVSGMVTPSAILPLAIEITDDFGISQASIRHKISQDDPTAPPLAGELPLSLASNQPLQTLDSEFRVGETQAPVGSRLNLQIAASDNDPNNGPKQAESQRLVFRVVDEIELREDLLRREREQEKVLTELLERQDLLRTDVRAFAAGTRATDSLTPTDRARLSGLGKQQSRITADLNSIIARFEAILRESDINQLEDAGGQMQERLTERVIAPLREGSEVFSARGTLQLELARGLELGQAERAQALTECNEDQSRVIGKIKQALRHLIRNEDFQMAVNLLYDLKKSQEDVKELTQKEKEDRIKELLKKEQDSLPKTEKEN